MAFKANSIGVYRGENCCTKTFFFNTFIWQPEETINKHPRKKNSILNYLSETHLLIIQYNWYHFLKNVKFKTHP